MRHGLHDGLLADFAAGRRVALARAISIVENREEGFEEILHHLHARLGRAHRIAVTGPSGAGKSTLLAQLIGRYRAVGKSVAVLAVDPSSTRTGGALLGDRLRMNSYSTDAGVFMRSMAHRGHPGAVAAATAEVVDLLDAFGFDLILVETVGAGQSETAVGQCVDSVVLVLVPESGDAIQLMKAGFVELADVFVVNKAERSGGDALAREIERSMEVGDLPAGDLRGWLRPVVQTVASEGRGVDLLIEQLESHLGHLQGTGELKARRRSRWAARAAEAMDREIRRRVAPRAQRLLQDELAAVEMGEQSPYSLALRIADQLGLGD